MIKPMVYSHSVTSAATWFLPKFITHGEFHAATLLGARARIQFRKGTGGQVIIKPMVYSHSSQSVSQSISQSVNHSVILAKQTLQFHLGKTESIDILEHSVFQFYQVDKTERP